MNLQKTLLTLLGACSLAACDRPAHMQKKDLEGAWRTDSISNYVNGFSFTNNTFDEHWSTFEYTADGTLVERKKEKFKKYHYALPTSDSLIYSDSLGHRMSGFGIVKLDERQLILKKAQRPYLPGKNQELYEIRYFSKITDHKK